MFGILMFEMVIDSIRVSLMNYQRVVILKEKHSKRYLPMWIGTNEAEAIALKLEDVSVPRPMTHDLLCNSIESLGAKLDHVVVWDVNHEDTFMAKIVIDFKGDLIEIDSRPSDALALAVRTNAPIYAEDKVLDKAGLELDKNDQELSSTETYADTKDKKLSEQKELKLSAFDEFMEELDLDDF
jgi:bifunctional DNase/RNase